MDAEKIEKMLQTFMKQLIEVVETCKAEVEQLPRGRSNAEVQLKIDQSRSLAIKLVSSTLPSEDEISDAYKRLVLEAWLKKVADEADSHWCFNLLGFEACISHLRNFASEYAISLYSKFIILLDEDASSGAAQSKASSEAVSTLAAVLATFKVTLNFSKEKNASNVSELAPRVQAAVCRCVLQFGSSSLILSRLSALLLQCPAFIPTDPGEGERLDLLLIEAVANLTRIHVKTIDHMTNICNLIYYIWNYSSLQHIFMSLKSIYAIIANRSPTSHLSPALAHVLTFVPEKIVRTLAPHILVMPSCNSHQNFKNTLFRLCIWMGGWPAARETLVLWQRTIVQIMTQNGMMHIVQEVAIEVVPKLMNLMRLPAIRDNLLDAIALLLVSCQSNSDAYRKCFKWLLLWGDMLKAEDLAHPKPLHVKFSMMCLALVNLFPDCHDLNDKLLDLIAEFPVHDHSAVLQFIEDHDWARHAPTAGVNATKGLDARTSSLADLSVAAAQEDQHHAYSPSQTELPDESIVPRVNRLPAGIDNIGSTCYYNAIIQALFGTDPFRHAVVTSQDSLCATHETLQELFSLLLFTEQASIEPSKAMVTTVAPEYFEPGQQHDASEFLGHLLDSLKESEKECLKKSYERHLRMDVSQQNNISKDASNSITSRDDNSISRSGDHFGEESNSVEVDNRDPDNADENQNKFCSSVSSSVRNGRRDSAIDSAIFHPDETMETNSPDSSMPSSKLEGYKTDSYLNCDLTSRGDSESSRNCAEVFRFTDVKQNTQKDGSSFTEFLEGSDDIHDVVSSNSGGHAESIKIGHEIEMGSVETWLESSPNNGFRRGSKIKNVQINETGENILARSFNETCVAALLTPDVEQADEKSTAAVKCASSSRAASRRHGGRRHSSPKRGVRERRCDSSDIEEKYSSPEVQAAKKVKANLTCSMEASSGESLWMDHSSVLDVSVLRKDSSSSGHVHLNTSDEAEAKDSQNSIIFSSSSSGGHDETSSGYNASAETCSSLGVSVEVEKNCTSLPDFVPEYCHDSLELANDNLNLVNEDGRTLRSTGKLRISIGDDHPISLPDDAERRCAAEATCDADGHQDPSLFLMGNEESALIRSQHREPSESNSINDVFMSDVSAPVDETSNAVTGDGASDDNSDSGISIQDDLANSGLDTASTVGGVTEEEVDVDEELMETLPSAEDEAAPGPLCEEVDSVDEHSSDALQTLVENIFGGRTVRLTHCLKCHCISENYDDSLDLKVSFEDCPEKRNSIVSLDILISHSLKKQELSGSEQYFCETCDSKQDAEIHTAIVKAPEFLILAQNRFIYNSSTNEESKILTRVDFEDHLEVPVWDVASLKECIRSAPQQSLGDNHSILLPPIDGPTTSTSDDESSLVSSSHPDTIITSSLHDRTEKLSLNLSDVSLPDPASLPMEVDNDSGEHSCDQNVLDYDSKFDTLHEPNGLNDNDLPLKNTSSDVVERLTTENNHETTTNSIEREATLNVKISNVVAASSEVKNVSSECNGSAACKNNYDNMFRDFDSQVIERPSVSPDERNSSVENGSVLKPCHESEMDSLESPDQATAPGPESSPREDSVSQAFKSLAAEPANSCEHPGFVKERYVLYAIVVHSGKISRAGHYYSYVRSSSAAVASSIGTESASLTRGCGWAELNDSKSYSTSFREIKSSLTGSARDCAPYLMFYQKVSDSAVTAPTRVEEDLKSLPQHLQEVVRRHVHRHRQKDSHTRRLNSSHNTDGSAGGGSPRGGGKTTGCGGGSALDVVRFIY
ncbi:uncharacterized protein LOC108682838 [Hyalella azteca]|uniref:Uncharacterized protein LOC108682838 n=1 Tax=Hyalella azteca TaxID=294128 RepID=A0A8B7PQM4_HYAAZ|nr:uncharacterized protein LOC108682838 [Hyalella azteca]